MVRGIFAAALMLVSFACGGTDSAPSGDGGGDGADDGFGGALRSGNNDSDHDDGSGWPRWKNPCPGPACDPPRQDRGDAVINPAPDLMLAPAPFYDGRGPRRIR